EKAKDYWKRILDKLNPDNNKRSVEEVFYEDEDIKTELGRKLKERFEEILKKVKEAVEQGKGVKEEYLEKLKEIRGKLKDLKVELGEKAKELIERLKEKAKDYWKKILDKLNPDKDAVLFADEDIKTELGRKLKERFEEILKKVKEAVEQGKGVKEEYLEKLKEIRGKLKDLKVELGEKAKELIERLKEKAKDYWKKILDKLNPDKDAALFADDDIKTELGQKLKERFDEILEKIKEAIENGRTVKEENLEKLKEIREQLKDLKVDISNKAKELLKNLKEKAKDYWNKLLDKLRPEKADQVSEADFNIFEMFNKLKKYLKEKFDADQLKEKVESLFGKGSELAEQLVNLIKTKGDKGKKKILDWIDRVLGEKEEKRSISEVYEKIKNYFKDLGIDLKEKFTKFGEWVKEKYAKGLEKGKDRATNLKRIAKEVSCLVNWTHNYLRLTLEFSDRWFDTTKLTINNIFLSTRIGKK
ncbi:hypothetical protein AVEN_179890-1, partial [Araneus ventricosus]